jgi:hypothetical protein
LFLLVLPAVRCESDVIQSFLELEAGGWLGLGAEAEAEAEAPPPPGPEEGFPRTRTTTRTRTTNNDSVLNVISMTYDIVTQRSALKLKPLNSTTNDERQTIGRDTEGRPSSSRPEACGGTFTEI